MGEKTQVKLLPPDGGWGYAICFAAILMMIPVSGFRPSFGMMYHDIMDDIGMDSTTIGLATGLTVMIAATSALLASSVLKVMSVRQGALLAATLINVGSIALVFSNSVPTFLLTQTFIQSSGFGLSFNLSYTAIREYFLQKRLMAISIVQTTIALSVMCTPIVIKYATDYYGFRGMLILIAGFSLHQFIGVTLLQPVARHMKKVEIPGETDLEMNSLLQKSENTNSNDVILNVKNGVQDTSVTNLKTNKDSESLNLNNKKSAVYNFFNRIIDMELFKWFILSIPNLNSSIATFTTFIYIVMLPRALYAKGETHNEVAWTLSLVGFGDLGMKIAFIFLSTFLKKVESRKLHLVGAAIACAARTGFQLTTNSIAKYVLLICMGIGQCFIQVLMPLVIADTVAPAKYSAAMGMNGLCVGLFNLFLGPTYGAIKDVTGSFDVVFWICIAIFFGIAILWVIDIKTNKKDNNLESNNT